MGKRRKLATGAMSVEAEVRQLIGYGWDTSPIPYIPCQACNRLVQGRVRRFDKRAKWSGKFVCRLCIHSARECKLYFGSDSRCDKYCKQEVPHFGS